MSDDLSTPRPSTQDSPFGSTPKFDADVFERELDDDRAYFASVPFEGMRVRRPFHNESLRFQLSDPPPGTEWFVLVEQTINGIRYRRPFYSNLDVSNATPEQIATLLKEHLGWKLFSEISRAHTGNYSVT
jgi:hypothetical protein